MSTKETNTTFASPLEAQILPVLTKEQTEELVAHRLKDIFGVDVLEKTVTAIASAVYGGHKPLEYFFPEVLPEAPKEIIGTNTKIAPLGELPCVKEVTVKYPWAEPILCCPPSQFYVSIFIDKISVSYYRTAKDRLLGRAEYNVTLAAWCSRRRVDPVRLEREFFEYNRKAFLDTLTEGREIEDTILEDEEEVFSAYTNFINTHSNTYPGLYGSCMKDPDLGEPDENIHPVMAYGGNTPDPARLWVLRVPNDTEAHDTMARAVVHDNGYVRLYLGGNNLLDSMFLKYEAEKRLKARGYTYDPDCLLGATLQRIEIRGTPCISAPYLDGNFKHVREYPKYLQVVSGGKGYSLFLEEHSTGRLHTTLVRCKGCGEYHSTASMHREYGTSNYYCEECGESTLYHCDYCCVYHNYSNTPSYTYKGETLCDDALRRKGLAPCASCVSVVEKKTLIRTRDYRSLIHKSVCPECMKSAVVCADCGDVFLAHPSETREALLTAMYIDDGSRFGKFLCRDCIYENTGITLGAPLPTLDALTATERITQVRNTQLSEETKEEQKNEE